MEDVGSIPVRASDRTAGRVDRAAGERHGALAALAPIVAVLIVEKAKAVVASHEHAVGTAPDQQFVLVLNDQIAGRCVDRDVAAEPSGRRVAQRPIRAKHKARAALQANPIPGNNRNHGAFSQLSQGGCG